MDCGFQVWSRQKVAFLNPESRSTNPGFSERLLAVLASVHRGGKIGEHGTGSGVSTAWIASAITSETQLFTVEQDERLCQAVAALFADHPNIHVIQGDCLAALRDIEPFDFLFMDAGGYKILDPSNWERVREMVRIGGQIFFDDLAPIELWTNEMDDLIDRKREFAIHNDSFIGTEVRTTPTQVAVIATRVK